MHDAMSSQKHMTSLKLSWSVGLESDVPSYHLVASTGDCFCIIEILIVLLILSDFCRAGEVVLVICICVFVGRF